MAFLEENCVLSILTDGILSECHSFVCGDDDMDEFFQKDALDYPVIAWESHTASV